jgi:predicted ATPase/AraC-like DNA-binding protein
MTNRSSLNKKFAQQLNEIIDSNIQNERFGVSELAYELKMSRSNLHRKIKAATGESVSQYLKKVRLNKAVELLKEQSYTISEVAFAVGFGSVNYFSKCFKDNFGYPPSEVENYPEDDEDSKTLQEKINVLKNFPVQTTSFIGRETEIHTILSLVKENRIVSLIGTGGCGKTRLACEAVSKLAKEYKDGIWFVNLVPVETKELVTKQVMSALDIAEVPGKEMMDVLIERIQGKKLLILLDNCEHLLSACTQLSAKLIQSVPGLSIVATSREALNTKGEKVWFISPLSLVDPAFVINIEYGNRSEAVRLFADRALLNNPGFKLASQNISEVATVCQKVDGIPLAVELVAGRIKYMDVHTIIERFGGRLAEIPSRVPGTIERHKTLMATIEWSYNLLSEEEKTLFRRLSVFTGGFDLNSAEEVCANEFLSKERILDVLPHLIDICMIQTTYSAKGQMRYKIMETLRHYGKRLLLETREADETREKHLEYFTWMAEEAFQERLKSQQTWIDRLDQEHDNLISALNWSDKNSPDMFVRLAGALGWFWRFHSHMVMGRDFLERALAKNTIQTESYARVLYGLGLMLSLTEDVPKAIDLLNESLNLWRQNENIEVEAAVLRDLIFPYQSVGDLESSQVCGRQCMELAKKTSNLELINHCLGYVCFTYLTAKNFTQVKPLVDELLDTSGKLNQPDGIILARHYMGDCALGERDFREAERRYALSIETCRKYGNTLQSITDLQGIAFAVSGQSRCAKSIRLDAAAHEEARQNGIHLTGLAGFWDDWISTYIEGARKEVGEELTKQYQAEGRAMSFDEAVEYALNVEID